MGFGERLKELRESKGMSQKELAKCVDVSDAAIANYEKMCIRDRHGVFSVPSARFVKDAAMSSFLL